MLFLVITIPLGNEVGKFLWNLAEQKNGYSFGKPWKQTETSLGLVIPILRKQAPKRDYEMLEETNEKIEIEDTGRVNLLKVLSKSDKNVFIRSGVIFEGDAQSRAVVSGLVMMPNSQQEIDVKCVYASKPTHRGAKMKEADIAPPIVMQSLHSSQRETWDAVSFFSQSVGKTSKKRRHMRHSFSERPNPRYGLHSGRRSRIGSSNRLFSSNIGNYKTPQVRQESVETEETGSDDLLGTMREVEESQKSIENAINDIPVQENQVGAIIFDFDSIIGFEVFDSPQSWKALHKKVIKKYNKVLRKEQEKMLFELKPEVIPEKISEFIEELIDSDEITAFENEKSKTIVIDGDRYIGEYTELKQNIIHLIAFKKENARKKKKKQTIHSSLE